MRTGPTGPVRAVRESDKDVGRGDTSVIAKGKTAGLSILEVWVDGESSGYLTHKQTFLQNLQVPADGGITQAHIRQDKKTGRYHMRVELPPAE